MKTFVYIIKGLLLWFTALSITLFIIGGFESFIEAEKWLPAIIWLVINISLGCLCYCNLSYREFYKLSGCQWFEKLIEEDESVIYATKVTNSEKA